MTDLIPIRRELLETIDQTWRVYDKHSQPPSKRAEEAICNGLRELRAALAAQVQGEAVAWARQCDLDESDPAIFVAREEVQESGYLVPLYTAPQPGAVPDASRLDADDVRAACQNAIEVFADEENAEQCREVAEYMREVLLVDLDRAAPATVQGDGWIPIIERLPQIKQVLSEKCTLEGREIPTLYRSGMVLTFDGSRVSAGIVEWFHSKSPLNNVTHWMPLPAAPGRQEVK